MNSPWPGSGSHGGMCRSRVTSAMSSARGPASAKLSKAEWRRLPRPMAGRTLLEQDGRDVLAEGRRRTAYFCIRRRLAIGLVAPADHERTGYRQDARRSHQDVTEYHAGVGAHRGDELRPGCGARSGAERRAIMFSMEGWRRSATRADHRRYNPGIPRGGMNMTMTRAAAVSAALVAMVFRGLGVEARQSAQDLAVKLTGTWVFNRDLSSGFGGAGWAHVDRARPRGSPLPQASRPAAAGCAVPATPAI